MIEAEAKSSTAFTDITGALRKSIRAVKSKYDEGGWIVKAGGRAAPHAHLVEYGHGGPQPAPPHAFLRPAKDKVIRDAIRLFGAK
jgi:HK97 gp10 family phage protein